MKVLVVGYGSAGRRHAANAREMGCDVIVRDRVWLRMNMAADDGFETTPDLSSVPCDAAVIATPARSHLEVAADLLHWGYRGPLFVEKPLDIDLADREFWWAWPNPTTMVGYNWRFVDEVVRTQAEAGNVVEFSSVMRTDVESWPGHNYASPLLECSHDLDLVAAFMPKVVSASAMKNGSGYDIQLDCDSEAGRAGVARVKIVTDSAVQRRKLRVTNERGASFGYVIDLSRSREAVELSYAAEMWAFLESARRGVPVHGAATFEDGLNAIALVELIEALCE